MKTKRFLLPIFLSVAALLYLLSLRAYYVGFFNDDAYFLIGAKSLLSGQFVELNQLAQPSIIHYTPGYSLLLAPLVAIFGLSTLVYQLFSVAMVVGSYFLAWLLLRDVIEPIILWPTLILSAFNPVTVSLSGTVLSDIPFLFFSLAFFVMLRGKWDQRDKFVWAGFGVAAAFLFYLRPIGLVLPFSVAVALLLERRAQNAAVFCAVSLLTVLPWIVRNQVAAGSPLLLLNEYHSSYAQAQPWLGIVRLIASNARFYTEQFFSISIFRWPFAVGKTTAAIVAIGMGIIVSILGLRKLPMEKALKAVWIYVAFYALVHLGWGRQVNRYFLPVFPFLLTVFFSGWPKRRGVVWSVGVIGLLCCAFPIYNIVRTSLMMHTPLNTPPRETYGWIQTHVPIDAVCGVEVDGRMYLFTKRPTAHLPRVPDREYFDRWVSERNVRYVVLFENDMVAPTFSGNKIYQPLEMGLLRSYVVNSKRYRRVFESETEGSEIYEVI